MKNTLLLADNNVNFRETWGKVLAKAGYEIKLASTPGQAQDLLRKTGIDLAILDLRLINDEDEKDLSGLEIAKDKAFRHIPKIILTAFRTSYENLRNILGSAFDELPPAIAFVDKAEGPEALLDIVLRALEIWPHLRMSTARVSEQIKADHSFARKQARIDYTMTFIVSTLGFVMIFVGICLAWFDKLTIGIVGTASGILLEALGYLFFTRLDRANDRMDTYHRELLQTYWLELLLVVSEQLPSERQIVCTENAIGAATESWLGSQPYSKTTLATEPRGSQGQEG